MQLDIFNDSRDVMLRNDVLQALNQQQPELAQSAWCTLHNEYPEDASLAALQTLIDALAAFNANTESPAPRFTEHVQLQQMQQVLQALPQVTWRDEPPGTFSQWRSFTALDSASPKAWMNAYLAAFAIASGLRLVTLDRDFQNFVPQGLDLRLLGA